MKPVERFLKLNGFTKKDGIFRSPLCNVEILDECYAVHARSGAMLSTDHNIYWLIGVLTYYGLIDKNYKQ